MSILKSTFFIVSFILFYLETNGQATDIQFKTTPDNVFIVGCTDTVAFEYSLPLYCFDTCFGHKARTLIKLLTKHTNENTPIQNDSIDYPCLEIRTKVSFKNEQKQYESYYFDKTGFILYHGKIYYGNSKIRRKIRKLKRNCKLGN